MPSSQSSPWRLAQVRGETWRGFGGLTATPLASTQLCEPVSRTYLRHLLRVCPKPLPVRQKSCSSRLRAARCIVKLPAVPVEASYGPGELETSVAAATAWRRRGCSGSPSELFAPVTAAQLKLRRSWKRPAASRAVMPRRVVRIGRERHARRAARPSFWSVRRSQPAETRCAADHGLRRGHEETRERKSGAAPCGAGGLPPTADRGEMRTPRERRSRNFPTQT